MKHMTNKETLSAMNGKEKIKFIWYYYKIHIVIALIVIISASSFIYTKVSQKKTYCCITYIGGYMKDKSMTSIKAPLNNALLKNNKDYTFEIHCDYINNDPNDNKKDFKDKIAAEISAKSIDIAIVSNDFFESNLKRDMFLDLNSLEYFSSLNLSDYVIMKGPESANKNCTYGIVVNDKMKILNKVNFNTDCENILVVISNTKNKQAAAKTIKLLTNN